MEGTPLDVGAAVDVQSGDVRATRRGRMLSEDFVGTRTRMQIDPTFEAAEELTSRQAEHIRNDLAQLVPAAASVLPLIRPELVKGLAILLHEYLSRPRLQSSSAAFPARSWQPCTVTAASPSGSTVPGWPRLSARRAQTRSPDASEASTRRVGVSWRPTAVAPGTQRARSSLAVGSSTPDHTIARRRWPQS